MVQQVQPGKDTYKHCGGLRLKETHNKELLVSVVCVTLNAAQTLPFLIKSVNEFKTGLVEFVVVDGESTDGTIDIWSQAFDNTSNWSHANTGWMDFSLVYTI